MHRRWMLSLSFAMSLAVAPQAWAQFACQPPPNPYPEYCSLDDGLILIEWYPSSVALLTWQPEHGFDDFNIYRGRLKALVDANHDGVLDSYGTCLVEQTTQNPYFDPDVPPLGDAALYIVTGQTFTGESTFGVASNGAPRPNASPCSAEPGHPVIETFGPVAGAGDGHASCDVTQAFKGFVCDQGGIPASSFVSFPTLTLGVDFTEIHLQARVTDPDSTPVQSDISQVTTTFASALQTPSPTLTSQDLLDDASATVTPVSQRTPDRLLDCDGDPDCPHCQRAFFPTTSHDLAVDDTYSAGFAFLSGQVQLDAPAGVTTGGDLAFDCVAQARGLGPQYLDLTIGNSIDFSLKVRDRSGHVTQQAPVPGGTFDRTHLSCSGDECGCCLLLSLNPSADCAHRPGLIGVPGSGFEQGLCVAFF